MEEEKLNTGLTLFSFYTLCQKGAVEKGWLWWIWISLWKCEKSRKTESDAKIKSKNCNFISILRWVWVIVDRNLLRLFFSHPFQQKVLLLLWKQCYQRAANWLQFKWNNAISHFSWDAIWSKVDVGWKKALHVYKTVLFLQLSTLFSNHL